MEKLNEIFHSTAENLTRIFYRVVAVLNGIVKIFDIQSHKLTFSQISLDDFEKRLMLPKDDPKALRIVPQDHIRPVYDTLTAKQKEETDERLKIVETFLKENGTKLYNNEITRKDMQEFLDKHGYNISSKTLLRYLLRYFSRGMDKESLVSDKVFNGYFTHSCKSGPKSGTGSEKPGSCFRGVMELAYDEYIVQGKKSVSEAYRCMLHDYFGDKNKDKPSESSFRDVCERFRLRPFDDKWETMRVKALTQRVWKGREREMVKGVMEINMIDSTVLDIYVVSEDRKKVLGRPTLFLSLDVMSRLITGYSLGLESAGYRYIADLLANIEEDKEFHCQKLGIKGDIAQSWPNSGLLPSALICDNFEMASGQSTQLARQLGICIINCPAYTPQRKGGIERQFSILNSSLKDLAGYVEKTTFQRGQLQPPEKANITLAELNRLIVQKILELNTRKISHFEKNRLERDNNISPVPTRLYEFYTQQKLNLGFPVPFLNFAKVCLPNETRKFTKNGVNIFGQRYVPTGSKAEAEDIKNRLVGKKGIVFYDPRDIRFVYFLAENELTTLYLVNLDEYPEIYSFYEDQAIQSSLLEDSFENEQLKTIHSNWQKIRKKEIDHLNSLPNERKSKTDIDANREEEIHRSNTFDQKHLEELEQAKETDNEKEPEFPEGAFDYSDEFELFG